MMADEKPKRPSSRRMKKYLATTYYGRQTNMASDVHNTEDIRRLIYQEPPQEEKCPMYHSKFSEKVREDVKKVKSCHKTFGYAEVPLDSPTNFLKKKTRIVRRPVVDKQKFVREPKPSLPPKSSRKECEEQKKNFQKENIVHAVRSVPRHPVPQVADTRTGHTQPLVASGLQPTFIYSKEFGKIPKYLRERYKTSEHVIRKVKEKEDEKKKPPVRYVTEDEREDMLQGLKKNWEELQKEFQLLPMVTDTVPKIKRKTQLEKRLRELEKDIDLIERNPIIYVCRDTDSVAREE